MKNIGIASAVIKKGDQYLIAQRKEPKFLEDKWEFPGGTIEKGETVEETLHREIIEEIGLDVEVEKHLADMHSDLHNRNIDIHFFLCKLDGDEKNIKLTEHKKWTWVSKENYKDFEYTNLAERMILRLFK